MAEGFFEDIHREHIHESSLKEFFGLLDTSHQGLNPQQVTNRQARFGKNRISEKKRAPFILRYGKHVFGLFPLLLWIGAGLSFFGEYFDPGEGMLYIGIALLSVIFINATFTYWQEAKVEHAMAAFRRMLSSKVLVFRDGREKEIESEELVPGDVLVLREGDKIPADARLFEVNALKVNNASLTGESEPQLRCIDATSKNYLDSRNLVFSGTLVSAGSGRAIVYSTGDHTELGRIARVTLETKSVDSPMQREIKHFSKVISTIAVSLGILFFIVGWLIGNPFWGNLIFAIGIIVANVPEGLLPTVTLALSIASTKMAKKNALIKTLESVETLGSTTVICTDKTGTLTLNNMRVTNIYLNLNDYTPANGDNKDTSDTERIWNDARGKEPEKKVLERAVWTSTLCNNASIHRDGTFELIGDPTETALLLFADQFATGPNIDWLRQEWPRIIEIPFDSETKEMITIHRNEDRDTSYLKGAPEVVLEHCDKILIDGKIVKFTHAQKARVIGQNTVYADGGKRVLGLAYKHIPPTNELEMEAKKQDYIFVGLTAMYDPPRPEVRAAVEKCRAAGIKIVVVSGDHPLTVQAIAREVGIVTEKKPLLLTGDDLTQLSHSGLKEALTRNDEIVLARTSPQDKMRVVSALQELGHVVAVTGDGVNDAPALKKADIGIAMGIAGTDVAKEAANMVLMDDNFSTIVTAVEEGRVIYSNIRKFVAYILTSNIPEIVPFIAFVLLNIPLPLTVMLILAIDLGTDLVPALGLATEDAEYDVMHQQPRARTERLMSGKLLFMSYGIIGVIQAAAGFMSYFAVLYTGGWRWGQELAFSDPLYRTAIGAFFVSIIIAQVTDVLICRTRKESIFTRGVFTNKLVWIGIGFELLLCWLIVSTSVGNMIFNTLPLPSWVWLIPIPFAIWIFVSDEIRKLLRRRGNTFVEKWLTW